MARIKLKQVDGISRKPLADAYSAFMRHCQLKNLSPYSYLYYEKNLQFFFELIPKIKYVDEITKGIIEEYVGQLMDRGNRVTAINARLRAVHVFLRYCFEQEYLEAFSLSQIKEDESFKEPYFASFPLKRLRTAISVCLRFWRRRQDNRRHQWFRHWRRGYSHGKMGHTGKYSVPAWPSRLCRHICAVAFFAEMPEFFCGARRCRGAGSSLRA